MSYEWRNDARQAADPNSSRWLLMRAARDRRVSVRRAVAANPALPSDARDALLKDADQRVLRRYVRFVCLLGRAAGATVGLRPEGST